jgi:hypothetical protein
MGMVVVVCSVDCLLLFDDDPPILFDQKRRGNKTCKTFIVDQKNVELHSTFIPARNPSTHQTSCSRGSNSLLP